MNSQREEELKPLPCPFCGNKPEWEYHEDPTYPQVECRNIECPIGMTNDQVSLESWNTRQAATEQGVVPVRGDSVSIDVSTDEVTAGNRVFGTFTGERNSDPERTWLAELDHFNYPPEQGVGEPVGEIAISNDGNTAQLFYSAAAIKALGLEDGSFIDVYTHPPKTTGGGVPDESDLWSVLEAATEAMDRKALPHAYISIAWNAGAEVITKRRHGGDVKTNNTLRAAQSRLKSSVDKWPEDFSDALLATQQPPEQDADK